MTIVHLLQLIVGQSGRYLRGRLSPAKILNTLLSPIRNRKEKKDSKSKDRIAVQIINGQRELPAQRTKPYCNPTGLIYLVENLRKFVAYYHSEDMLYDIYNRVHTEVSMVSWAPAKIALMDTAYVATNPSLDDIATYLAAVIYSIIAA